MVILNSIYNGCLPCNVLVTTQCFPEASLHVPILALVYLMHLIFATAVNKTLTVAGDCNTLLRGRKSRAVSCRVLGYTLHMKIYGAESSAESALQHYKFVTSLGPNSTSSISCSFSRFHRKFEDRLGVFPYFQTCSE